MHDVFICHANEDKEQIARPLAEGLRASGLNVWYDEFSLNLGDSLRESIDRGLADSRFGMVVLSHHFFSKKWPQAELNGLIAIETAGGGKKIIPIWHEITQGEITKYSPILADRVAVPTTVGLDRILERILDAINPGWQHKAGMGRVVAITPTSIRLHSGEWQVQTPITITNRSNVPAYCVVLKILIHGQGITASSLWIEVDSQAPPLETAIGDIIVSADQLRLNCLSKDGQQIVLLILHTVPANGNRTISIKGTAPFNSSADIVVVDVNEKPQELLTRKGQEFAIMFKPTEDVVVNGVSLKMRRKP
jgi:hypothetical protein